MALSKHDQAIKEEASKITNPIDWSLLFDLADKAESEDLKIILVNKAQRFYHLEESCP